MMYMVYGVAGSNVRVAVWEDGPDIETDLVISAFYDPSKENNTAHATVNNCSHKK